MLVYTIVGLFWEEMMNNKITEQWFKNINYRIIRGWHKERKKEKKQDETITEIDKQE